MAVVSAVAAVVGELQMSPPPPPTPPIDSNLQPRSRLRPRLSGKWQQRVTPEGTPVAPPSKPGTAIGIAAIAASASATGDAASGAPALDAVGQPCQEGRDTISSFGLPTKHLSSLPGPLAVCSPRRVSEARVRRGSCNVGGPGPRTKPTGTFAVTPHSNAVSDTVRGCSISPSGMRSGGGEVYGAQRQQSPHPHRPPSSTSSEYRSGWLLPPSAATATAVAATITRPLRPSSQSSEVHLSPRSSSASDSVGTSLREPSSCITEDSACKARVMSVVEGDRIEGFLQLKKPPVHACIAFCSCGFEPDTEAEQMRELQVPTLCSPTSRRLFQDIQAMGRYPRRSLRQASGPR
mmetsp:Transcript_75461/g.196274  ORF Transcript_75461/g.196274 Transcript_75461/m.196274 type:complete len:349 (+) Transcript_75461:94-1140(+)